MKKIIILGLLSVVTLFLTACEVDWSKIDLSKVDTDEIIKCEAPYIRVGADCCVDQNDNKICDTDELELEKLKEEIEQEEKEETEEVEEEKVEEEEGCEDECSSDFCTGLDYTECLMKSDGCKDKNFRGKVPGKCDVECTTDNNCDSDEECKNYKCVEKGAECEDECNEGDVGCLDSYTLWKCTSGEDGCYYKSSGWEECREGETCKNGRCCTKSLMECEYDSQCEPEAVRALWCVGDDVYGEDWQVSCINPNTPESYCERCVINKKVGHCEGCVGGACPTEGEPVEEEPAEEVVEEEKELSGVITITIDEIYTAVTGDDLGEISKVVFTIDNGKDAVFKPLVKVYAWDDENKDYWGTNPRAEYTYLGGINPGDGHTASVDLVPKTWMNLELEKTVALALLDADDGWITDVRETVTIS